MCFPFYLLFDRKIISDSRGISYTYSNLFYFHINKGLEHTFGVYKLGVHNRWGHLYEIQNKIALTVITKNNHSTLWITSETTPLRSLALLLGRRAVGLVLLTAPLWDVALHFTIQILFISAKFPSNNRLEIQREILHNSFSKRLFLLLYSFSYKSYDFFVHSIE